MSDQKKKLHSNIKHLVTSSAVIVFLGTQNQLKNEFKAILTLQQGFSSFIDKFLDQTMYVYCMHIHHIYMGRYQVAAMISLERNDALFANFF